MACSRWGQHPSRANGIALLDPGVVLANVLLCKYSTSVRLSAQLFRADEPTCSLAVWACVVPPSVMQHAVLLRRDSWMCFNNRAYHSPPPRPSDHRIFRELEVSRHALAGVRAYAIIPVASGGGFHLRYDGAVGVTLSDEPQSLAVKLVCSNGSQALTDLVHVLPQSGMPSGEENLSPLGNRSFPSLGWRISSLATSSESPTPRSCAFRWTPCSTTADPSALPLAHLR